MSELDERVSGGVDSKSVEPSEPVALEASPLPSRWPGRLVKGLVVGALLLLVLVGASPWLLSSGWGNRALLWAVNGRIAGTLEAESLRVGWLGGTGLRGCGLRDAEGAMVVSGLELDASELGVWDVLWGGALGAVTVSVEELSVVQRPGEPTNLERALSMGDGAGSEGGGASGGADAGSEVESGWALPVGRSFSATLTAGRVSYRALGVDGSADEETVVEDFSSSVDVSDAARVVGSLTARVWRDGVSGVVDAEVALVDALDESGGVAWRRGGVEARGEVFELPVGPVDRLLGLDGLLEALVGDRLEGELVATGTLAAPEATVRLKTSLLSLDASLSRSGDVVSVEPGAALGWRLTPAAFARLTSGASGAAEGEGEVGATLLEAVDVSLPIEGLSVSIGELGVAIEEASGRVTAQWSPARVRLADGRSVALEGGVLRVETSAVGERMTVALTADATVREASGASRADRVLARVNVLDLGVAFGWVSGSASASGADSDLEADAEVGLGLDVLVERFPLALADAWSGVSVPGGGLVAWLGPDVTVEAEVRLPRASGGLTRASGRVVSAGVTGPFEAAWSSDGSSGEVSTPEAMALRADPAVLRDWVGAEAWYAWPVGLNAVVEPTLMLREVRWGLLSEEALAVRASAGLDEGEVGAEAEAADAGLGFLARLDPSLTSGQVALSVPSVMLWDFRNDVALPELRGLQLEVAASDLARPVELVAGVNFDGPALLGESAVADGGATIRATGSGLVDRHGVFSPMGGTFDVVLRGTAVPSMIVDAFAGQEGKLAATLGEAIEPEVTARYRPGRDATLEVDVLSTNAVGSVLLSEDLSDSVWSPVLREDPVFTLSVTEPAVKAWMGRLHPVLADVVRSSPDAPATLRLDGSSFSLSPDGFFDLDGLVAEAALDLGTLELKRQGWLRQGVLGVVRQFLPDFRGGQGQTYLASFSPMRVNVADGVVSTTELWLTAEDMGVGFAGTVDLKSGRLDMGLGVLGATFVAAGSDFEKALEPLRVYELPVVGTLDSPKIQVDRFLGQVAAAYGRRELERNAEKLGEWGGLIGVIGGAVLEEGLEWKNRRAWSPSGPAQAFAVSVANPRPGAEAEAEAGTGSEAASDESAAEPVSEPRQREREPDEVERVLKGILDLIGESDR